MGEGETPTASVGLRVDVDTYRGTRDGVPRLLEILAGRGIRATFFFTLGPDNMGRHLWRLLRPAFLIKMLRSRAASLYGWDILLRGTFWPGPRIGRRLAHVIRAAADAGHEVGLHAWDHHRWQMQVERMDRAGVRREIALGFEALRAVLQAPPRCSAAAGWRCTEAALAVKELFGFDYNSDCRGRSIFRPVIGDFVAVPQVPVTLPTYDELIGRDGVDAGNYNERLLALVRPGRLNVLAIHAEVEGIACSALFQDFLDRAQARGIRWATLRELLDACPQPIPTGRVVQAPLPGRDGWICQQALSGAEA